VSTQATTPPRTRRALPGLLTATAASVTANALVAVLVPWLVLTRTGSAAQAGLVGSVALAAAVPALVAGGPLIDRWGRRRVSAGADLLSALAVAALPLVDATVGLTLGATLALVAVGALFDGPGAAAREAARPDVAAAGGTALDRVNARGEAAEQLGEVAGPALAGVGIAAVGALTSLWAAAALLVGAALTTWLTMPADGARPATEERYRDAAAAGLRVVWADRTLRAATLLGTVAMVFFAPLTLILTAHLAVRGEPATLGWVAGALGVGAIVGALGYARVAARVRRRTVLLTALGAAAVGLAAMSLLPGPVALALLALLTGAALGPLNPALAGVLQSRAPAGMRGRVVSTQWSLALLASPLGVLGAGLLLEAVGPGPALLTVAAGVLATGLLAAASRGVRDLDAPVVKEETP
jgi:MFS family permease